MIHDPHFLDRFLSSRRGSFRTPRQLPRGGVLTAEERLKLDATIEAFRVRCGLSSAVKTTSGSDSVPVELLNRENP